MSQTLYRTFVSRSISNNPTQGPKLLGIFPPRPVLSALPKAEYELPQEPKYKSVLLSPRKIQSRNRHRAEGPHLFPVWASKSVCSKTRVWWWRMKKCVTRSIVAYRYKRESVSACRRDSRLGFSVVWCL